MHPARISIVTLGVADLARSTAFYRAVFGVVPNPENQGISFFRLPGVWLALYPLDKLAEDIGPDVPAPRPGFSGMTLAHNARSREGVLAIFEHVRSVGGRIVKPPQNVFWGGFSGYFADPDGYFWEVAWGPMFEFTEDGALKP